MEISVAEIINTFLTVIAFLVAVATFILGFFMQLEFDNKLTDRMKKYHRILSLSLLIPSTIMISLGIYLITTTGYNQASIMYIMALTSVFVPIGVLLVLMTKK
jgi:hypothetical protein